MKCAELRTEVCRMNKQIASNGLAVQTWGNVSGIDRGCGIVAIKPSGVDYEALTPESIVLVSLDDASVVDGELTPSSDTLSHLEIYRGFPAVGGVVHTHSHHATAWAQARQEIPCLGTTHADVFYGPIPLTRMLTQDEVKAGYELNTGRVIVGTFIQGGIDPEHMPAVIASGHGPFAWGSSASKAVENAVVLEHVAQMALNTRLLNPNVEAIPDYLLDKHFLRKHGKNAYYGQG